jgi:septum formation protein
MDKLVLASGSPRRKELMDQTGVDYEICVPDVDESAFDFGGDIFAGAERLALLKARAVAGRFAGTDAFVVGADTVVSIDGVLFGKPADRADASRMIRALSGRTHIVLTGVAVIDARAGAEHLAHEITKVHFARLSEAAIEGYLDAGEWSGKAGAYAIQGLGALMVERIDGCFYNVVGLPLFRLHTLLVGAGHAGLAAGSRP